MSGNNYNHSEVEDNIYYYWEKNRLFKPKKNKKEFFIVFSTTNVTRKLHIGPSFNNLISGLLTKFHKINNYQNLLQACN